MSLLAFLALTFLVTWTCFITAVALSNGLPPRGPIGPGPRALVFLGTIAPSLVALGLTARAEGGAGVRALLWRVVRWQVGARWYAFAIGYMLVIRIGAALLHRLVAGSWPRFGFETFPIVVLAMFISTWVQAGEEIGWRGFALPRLAEHFGLAGASLVLGVIWAVWHLPLFFLQGADTYGQSFLAYLAAVVALSVAMAWLYWRTQGSLFLVMLMHAAINNTQDLVPPIPRPVASPFEASASLLGWLTAALLWAGAGYFLVRMRNADLRSTRAPSLAAEHRGRMRS